MSLQVGDKVWPRHTVLDKDDEAMLVTRVISVDQISVRDRHHGPMVFLNGQDSPRLESELVLVSCGHADCESNDEMMTLCLAPRACSRSLLPGHSGMAPPHACPYAQEILGDEAPCNCCDHCSWQCAQDI